MKKYLFTLSLITVMSFMAQAQNQVSATINGITNAAVTGSLTLGEFDTDTKIENGLVTEALNFAVKSNRLWKFTTSITNIVGTALPNQTIEAPLLPGNISYGVENGTGTAITSWVAFTQVTPTTTALIQAKTGGRGAPSVTGNTFTLRYKVTPTFAVDPGTYAIDVTHTVSAQ